MLKVSDYDSVFSLALHAPVTRDDGTVVSSPVLQYRIRNPLQADIDYAIVAVCVFLHRTLADCEEDDSTTDLRIVYGGNDVFGKVELSIARGHDCEKPYELIGASCSVELETPDEVRARVESLLHGLISIERSIPTALANKEVS